MRQDMNVEDEYFSIIKEQEGKLYGLEKDLAEKETLLAEKDGQIAEKDGQLAEKDGQLAEKDGQLKTLAKMLVQAGQTTEAIAKSLQVDEEIIKALLRP